MFSIKIKEIKALNENELKNRMNDLILELQIEKSKVASTGVSSKVVKAREIRRTIARIKTVLNERGATK